MSDSAKKITILLVEDDPLAAQSVQSAFRDSHGHDFEIVEVNNLGKARENLAKSHFDAVLLDLGLPDSAGLNTFLELHNAFPQVPIVVLTGLSDESVSLEAVRQGAQDYLVKGSVEPRALVQTLKYAIERKQIELALRETQEALEMRVEERTAELARSENRYKDFIQTIPDIIYELDSDGKFTFVSNAVKQLGYSPQELLGRHFQDIMHPEDFFQVSRQQVLPKYLGKITGDGNAPKLFDERRTGDRMTRNLEVRLKNKPGPGPDKYSYCEVHSSGKWDKPINEKEKILTGSIGIIRDITGRKQMEEELRYRNELGRIINILSTHFINVRAEEIDEGINRSLGVLGEFFDVERGYVFLLKGSSGLFDLIYEWCAEHVEPHLHKYHDMDLYKRFAWGMQYIRRLDILHVPDAADLPQEAGGEREYFAAEKIKTLIAVPMVSGGDLIGYFGFSSLGKKVVWAEEIISQLKIVGEIFTNAIMHRRSEEALASEKEQLNVTLRSIADAVIAVDIQGKIIFMNRAAENLTGWSHNSSAGAALEKVFRTVHEDTGAAGENPVQKVLARSVVCDFGDAMMVVARSGAKRNITYRASPIMDRESKVVGVVLVFSDITDKKKAEKEMLNAQKLESIGVLAGGIAHDFNNILTGIISNLSLAKMMKSSPDQLDESLTEAESACARAKDLTHQLLTFSKGGAPVKKIISLSGLLKETAEFSLRGSRVKCEFDIAQDLAPVNADAGQISQVIQNLVINACEAMPAGGTIRIAARDFDASADAEAMILPGKYVKISVADEGIGIPMEYLSRIFDPYFTTKQKGSGLGLSVTYAVVKKHNGYITVDSVHGKGTTFFIYLPAGEGVVEPVKEEGKIMSGKGKILVMDDEDLILRSVGRVLMTLGYEAEFARNGKESVDMYSRAKEQGKPYDAVILDLTVPGGMGGKEAVEELRKVDPKVKAIVSSGYSNDPIMSEYSKYGFSGVAVKPYSLEELSKVLHDLISGK